MNSIKKCSIEDTNKVESVLLETWLAKTKKEANETFVDEMSKWDDYFLMEDDWKPIWIVSGKIEWRPRHGIYELYHIGAITEARWKWVAKELFDVLVNHAKELFKNQWSHLRKFYLKTGEQNAWAHKFYEKMNMVNIDTLTSHFAKWRAELIYHLFFDEDGNDITKNTQD